LKYSAEARYDHVDDLGRTVAGYLDPISVTESGSSTVPSALEELHANRNAGVRINKVASDLD
ncbi:MAG: hypothetical protein ACREXY_17805, partial [Gammaproteobacteria bacterium]